MKKSLVIFILVMITLTACTTKEQATTTPSTTPIEISTETSNPEQGEQSNYLYVNEQLGFSVEFPENFNEQFGIDENYIERSGNGGAGITVYHKASRDAGYLGDLFYIERWIGEWSLENPPIRAGTHQVVAESDKYTFMLRTTSGVEYNEHDPETIESCSSLYAQYEAIGKSVKLINSVDSIPNAGYQTEANFLSENMPLRDIAYGAAESMLRADADKLSEYLLEPGKASSFVRGLNDVFDELALLQFRFVLSDIVSDNEIRASYVFALNGEDSYSYISMTFQKVSDEWKVDSIGIEK